MRATCIIRSTVVQHRHFQDGDQIVVLQTAFKNWLLNTSFAIGFPDSSNRPLSDRAEQAKRAVGHGERDQRPQLPGGLRQVSFRRAYLHSKRVECFKPRRRRVLPVRRRSHVGSISKKLMLAFAITTSMTLALGIFTIVRASHSKQELSRIESVWAPGSYAIGEMRAQFGDLRIYETSQVSEATSAEAVKQYEQRIVAGKAKINELVKQYLRSFADGEDAALFKPVSAALSDYFVIHDQLHAALLAGDAEAAQTISVTESRAKRVALFDAMEKVSEYNLRGMKAELATNAASLNNLMSITGLVLAVLYLVASVLGWAISRSVTRPIGEALPAIRSVANGDLNVRTDYQSRDEARQMLLSLRQMVATLERFSNDTKVMVKLHEAEDISHRIPEDLPGVYGELAKGMNTMVFEHLEAILDAIQVLNEYAAGDLRRDARRLPGSRACSTNRWTLPKQVCWRSTRRSSGWQCRLPTATSPPAVTRLRSSTTLN